MWGRMRGCEGPECHAKELGFLWGAVGSLHQVECGRGREKIGSVFILLTWCSTEEGLEYLDAGRPGRTLRTVEQGLEATVDEQECVLWSSFPQRYW